MKGFNGYRVCIILFLLINLSACYQIRNHYIKEGGAPQYSLKANLKATDRAYVSISGTSVTIDDSFELKDWQALTFKKEQLLTDGPANFKSQVTIQDISATATYHLIDWNWFAVALNGGVKYYQSDLMFSTANLKAEYSNSNFGWGCGVDTILKLHPKVELRFSKRNFLLDNDANDHTGELYLSINLLEDLHADVGYQLRRLDYDASLELTIQGTKLEPDGFSRFVAKTRGPKIGLSYQF